MTSDDLVTGAAWRRFCDRMAALGDRLLEDDFPGSEEDRAEGYRHLANQVACWLTYSVGHTDPRYPLLFRHNDLVYRWGGPNVDQNTRRAVIEGSGTYRLSGNLRSCDEFIVQVKAGEMHTGDASVAAEVSSTQLGLGKGDDFAVTFSASEQPGTWVALDPAARLLHVRDYYWGWERGEPASFVLERLDTQGVPKPGLEPATVAAMLEEAARQIEGSIVYWNRYQADIRAAQELNAYGEPAFVPEGVHDILYAHAFIRLGDGEALVVEVDPSEADAFDVQLYTRSWYEPLDFTNRTTSLNHVTGHRSPDGLVQIVVSATDPGLPNWLDTEGRAEVMSTIRWWRAPSPPTVRSAVVPVAELGPATVTAEQRTVERRARSAHTSWRYHT